MKLEPQEGEVDLVCGCGDDEGKAFLVLGFHGEGERCCDVSNCARSQWSHIQGLDRKGAESGYEVQGGGEGLVDKVPRGTRFHYRCSDKHLRDSRPVKWEPESVWWKTMIMEYSCLPWETEGHGAAPLLKWTSG